MVSRPVGSRCQSHAERNSMPAGMLADQNSIGLPATRYSIPSRPASAAMAKPNGPAPMMRASTDVFTLGHSIHMSRALALIATLMALGVAVPSARQTQPFPIEETTIAAAHDAMRDGRLTCRALVDHYLRRIAAFDRNGPAINALVLTNSRALAEADALDADSSRPDPPVLCTAFR